jgi:hypothetical protein
MTTPKDPGASPRLRLLTASALVAAAVAALGGLVPLRSWDLWWHVAFGAIIDHFSAVPIANHVLYSHPADAPAFDLPWLAQWALALMHRAGDVEAILTARNLLGGLAFGLAAFAASRRSGSALAGMLLAGVGASLAGHFTDAGPALLAAPLGALAVVACAEARGRASARAQLLAGACLAALAALWANLDHAFMLPALLAALLGFDAMTSPRDAEEGGGEGAGSLGPRWFAVAAICAAAPLLNPRGVLLFEHTLTALATYPTHPDATDWAPLLPWGGLEGAGVWGLAIASLAFRWRGPREGRAFDLGLLVVFAALAITHQRATLWFGLVLPFALATSLEGYVAHLAPPASRLPYFGALLAALALPWLTQPLVVTHRPIALAVSPFDVRREAPHAGAITADVPVTSVELLAQQLTPPRVYAPPHLSGYLLRRLNAPATPRQILYTDPRHELATPKLLEVRELIETTDVWRGLFQQYDVRAALLDARTQEGLVEALSASQSWQLMHTEGDYRMFLRVSRSGP